MFRFRRYRSLAALALCFAIMAVASCSEKMTSPEGQTIKLEISTPLAAPGQAAQAARYVLTVTGPGIMEPIVATLALSDGLLTGSIVVPAGPDRTFRIDAYDEAGTLIYSGQTVTDVVGGSELRLDIELAPRVPMIKVSPMYVETMQGDLLAMKIQVYNLGDIAGIDINLVDYRQEGDTYIRPTSVIVNPEIAKVAGSSITTEPDYSTTVRFTLRDVRNDLVDENGYAELATFYYQTQIYEVSPYETATFTPSVLLMTDKLGNEMPTEQIRAEASVVRLYDYWYRRIASWEMGYGAISSVIYDGSGNGLNGTATGTSALDGPYYSNLARFFNGSGDFVTVPDNALLDLPDEITISMWIYLTGSGLNPASSLICKRNADGAINYQLLLDDASSGDGVKSIVFRYGNSPYNTYRVDNLPDNRTVGWFHIVFSYRFGEPSSAMLVLGYGCTITEMQGAWVTGNGEAPPPNTSGPLLMGKDNATPVGYLSGGLYGVELFDIAWTWGVAYYNLFTGCR